jgi:hypothetical protein
MKTAATNKEKYLNKIKKLLRLARSTSSPEEAASAMAKVQAFMREHGLSDSDVDLAEIREAGSKSAPSNAKVPPTYMHMLAHLVCKAFGVECYVSGEWRSSGTLKRFVRFYGPDTRPEIAAYAFDVLVRQLREARLEYVTRHCRRCKPATRVARGDLFCEGWVRGANRVLKSFALTPAEKGMLERYEQKLRAERGIVDGKERGAKSCRGAVEAASAGYEAGKNARLHHGVDGHSDQPLGIGR